MEPSSGAPGGHAPSADEERRAQQREDYEHEHTTSEVCAGPVATVDAPQQGLRPRSVGGPLVGDVRERHTSSAPDGQPGTRSRIAG
jgi:hypothetical protein